MLADYSESQKAAIVKFGIDKAGAAIDVGCGIGEKTHYIAERVNFAVGVDPNEKLKGGIHFNGVIFHSQSKEAENYFEPPTISL